MNYSCKRCGYETDRVSNLRTHLKKKKTCRDVLKCGIDAGDLLKETEIDKSDFAFQCDKCQKKFKSKLGYTKHEESSCSVKKQDYNVAENPLFLI